MFYYNRLYHGSYQSGWFTLQWSDYSDYIDFNFTTKIISSGSGEIKIYAALGFSSDMLMVNQLVFLTIIIYIWSNSSLFKGNDDVVVCKYSKTNTTIERYFNVDKLPSARKLNKIGISNEKIAFDNGSLICSFRRVKYISEVKKYFDLNYEYYLLVAKGELSNSNFLLSY